MDKVALEYRDFGFTYAGASQTVLQSINWSVPEGAFVVMTGATGSGKTTLLRCAKPELRPQGVSSGEVLVYGKPFEELSPEESATSIGYVSQSPDNQLVCSEVWHQVAFGLENLGMEQSEMHRRVAEVAYFFNIEPWFDADVNSLSGGQKQLLALASTLVMQPRILLLDEPVAQLDPVASKNFLHALFRLNRELGMTVVVATHTPEVLKDYATDEFCLAGEESSPVGSRFCRGVLLARQLKSNAKPDTNFRASHESRARSATVRSGDDVNRVVQAKRLSFRYERQAKWVFRDASLEIREGEIHALVGGNGSGKSTLLQLFAGALKPEHGSVQNALKNSQAYLPQNPKALFHGDSVGEEIREWQETAGYADGDIEHILERFGLAQAVAREQHPYDLSGGQQQLLALAKLLLLRPRLLLLDEPSKGLDVDAKVLVAQALEQACAKGATIIMASHDLSFVQALATRVSMLFDGEVTCTLSTEEFFAGSMFYRAPSDAFSKAWSECRNFSLYGRAFSAPGELKQRSRQDEVLSVTVYAERSVEARPYKIKVSESVSFEHEISGDSK